MQIKAQDQLKKELDSIAVDRKSRTIIGHASQHGRMSVILQRQNMNIEQNRGVRSKLVSNGDGLRAFGRPTNIAVDKIAGLQSRVLSPVSFPSAEPSQINFIKAKPIGVKGAK